jgi:AbiU2
LQERKSVAPSIERAPLIAMPTRKEKLEAYAGHLLDVYRALHARYAILEPLLFDKGVVYRFGEGKRAHGLNILRSALLQLCALDIAKIVHDGDNRSPNVKALLASLDDDRLRLELREEFAIWYPELTEEDDQAATALPQEAERREEEKRRKRFDELLAEARDRSAKLAVSNAIMSFRRMRDELVAHNQLTFAGNAYVPLDVTKLGLKLGDFGKVIDELERLMDLLTLLFRNASFDFPMLREQLVKDRDAFWSPTV